MMPGRISQQSAHYRIPALTTYVDARELERKFHSARPGERVTYALDHHAPEAGTLLLDILRVQAAHPAARRGNLFINPGGPGIPAFFFTASVVEAWEGDARPASAKRRISERHDMIAIQPRGLGGTRQLHCRSDAVLQPYSNITDDRSEANLLAVNLHAATIAQGCQAQPLARYINTDQIARDMEAVRQRLGGEPVNYWGLSWGTELGAWYGALFPQHVDRMILDSNVDWTGDLHNAWIAQGAARQEIFDRFVVDRVVQAPEAWGLGSSAADVHARFSGFLPASRQIVRGAFHAPEMMVAVDFLDRAMRTDPMLTEETLGTLARNHRYSTSDAIDLAARREAAYAVPQYFAPVGTPARLDLDPGRSTFHTVVCQSSQAMPPPAFWDDLGDEAARTLPVGGSHNSHEPCAYWTGPVSARPDMRRLSHIPNLMMLQAEYDWRTPRQGALNAHAQVAGASMVLAQGVETHGFAYNGASACVDEIAGRFMADGIKPARMHICIDDEVGAVRSTPPYLETLQDHLDSHAEADR